MSTIKKAFYPFLALLIGSTVAVVLVMTAQKPLEVERENPGVLVTVAPVTAESRVIQVVSHGTVTPRLEVALSPQVNGKVEWTDFRLVAGGLFRAGELMLRIEQVDYQLQVTNAEAAVTRAEYELAVMQGNAQLARQEWDIMQRSNQDLLQGTGTATRQETPKPLVLFEPQMRNARAGLESAKAQLAKARLELDRTIIKAPFNCRVRAKQVDVGQFVRSGNPIASVFGTDVAEIEVALQYADLQWFDADARNTPAEVAVNIQGQTYTWQGHVTRSLGEVDAMGRMAQVVIQIDDPFNRRNTWGKGHPELPLGMFVEVNIQGNELSDIIPIPRHALHPNNIVWVCTAQNDLELRSVDVARAGVNEALISGGLQPGETIVLSSLMGPAPGLKLRPVQTEDNQ
jgi:RND family efflux transporter MFP subunit